MYISVCLDRHSTRMNMLHVLTSRDKMKEKKSSIKNSQFFSVWSVKSKLENKLIIEECKIKSHTSVATLLKWVTILARIALASLWPRLWRSRSFHGLAFILKLEHFYNRLVWMNWGTWTGKASAWLFCSADSVDCKRKNKQAQSDEAAPLNTTRNKKFMSKIAFVLCYYLHTESTLAWHNTPGTYFHQT